MPRKKATPPAENPEDKTLNSAPEAAVPVEPSAPSVSEAPAAPEPVSEPAPEPPKEPNTTSPAPHEESEEPEAKQPGQTAPPDIWEDTPVFEQPDEPPAPPESAEPSAPEGRPALVVSPKGLNLREGPGFGFEALTILENGTLILILDLPMGVKVPGWELVNNGERTGWVSSRFLRPLME